MADMEVKETSSEKLNAYLERNKKPFVAVVVALVVILIGLIIVLTVSDKSKEKALAGVDEITYVLTDGSSTLEEAELNARRNEALEKLQSYTKKGGIAGARANLLAAELSYQQKNYDDAVTYWIAASMKSKNSYIAPLAYYNMGTAYEQMKKLDEAAASYKLASEDKDFTMKAHAKFSYARVLEAQGKTEEAKNVYTELANSNPDDTWAKLAKTRVLLLK